MTGQKLDLELASLSIIKGSASNNRQYCTFHVDKTFLRG